MITAFLRRVLPLLALAGITGFLVNHQGVPDIGSDGYLHLRIGQELLGGWSLGSPGHLSTFDTSDWLPTQWAPQLAMAGMHQAAGMTGFIWIAGVVILCVPAVLYAASRSVGASPLPAAVSAGVALLAMSSGLSARPQVISYVFVVITTAAWIRTATDGRPRYWIILVNWLWVPMHGMWVVGVLISAAAVVGLCLERPRAPGTWLRYAAIPVGSAVIAVATPLGWGVYGAVGAVGSRASGLSEWRPTDFTQAPAAILVAMAAVVVLTAMRKQALSWPELALLGLACSWALYTTRTVDVAAAMLAPMLARALEHHSPTALAPSRREWAVVAAIVGAAAVALWPVAAQRSDRAAEPAWINARLAAMPEGTKVLNDWELGHDLLYRQPHLQLVLHGYLDVFTHDEVERNIDIADVQPGWDRLVEELDVDYALVQKDSPLGYALVKDEWREVEADRTYVLLLPPQ